MTVTPGVSFFAARCCGCNSIAMVIGSTWEPPGWVRWDELDAPSFGVVPVCVWCEGPASRELLGFVTLVSFDTSPSQSRGSLLGAW